MKQILSFLLMLTIVFTFAGCSSKTSSEKSKEELKAEIKAEMKAEMEAEEKKKEELKAEMEAEEKKKEEEKIKEEKIIGPVNMAIKNYDGEGLERLSKKEVECKAKYSLDGKTVNETLAIFGEVTNVKIGYIRLFTEGNYGLIEKYDSLKDTQLTIKRGSNPEDLIAVSFYDGGFREHTVAFTSCNGELGFLGAEDKAQLVTNLEEEYSAKTSYKDSSNLILKALAAEKFASSNIFNNVEEKIDEFDGGKYYSVENEPLGYNIDLYKGYYSDGDLVKEGSNVSEIYIRLNEGYGAIKDDVKSSFFGVDFDMHLYQARYNLSIPGDNISIELVEDHEKIGKLMGITVSKISK